MGTLPEGESIRALSFDEENNGLWIAHRNGLSRYDFNSKDTQEILKMDRGANDLVVNLDGIFVGGGQRVFSSFDQGKSWNVSKKFAVGEVFRIEISKDRKVYAAVNQGWRGRLYVSPDQGQSWQEISGKKLVDLFGNPTRAWANPFGKIASIKINPFDDQELIETDWWGVWKSVDGGQSVEEIITGAPNAVGSDIHFSENGELYAATMDNGLLKSQDNGKQYEALFPKHGYRSNINGHVWRVTSSTGGRHIIATSSPWGQKINQIIVSNDGGNSFDIVQEGLPLARPQKNTMWHEGFPRALAIDPTDPSRVYLGIDGDDGGGLFISNDGGKSWGKSSGQPRSLRIYNGLAVDPTDSSRIVWGACGKGGGVYISKDRGKTWKHTFDKMKWVFDVFIDLNGVIYALGDSNGAAIFKSEDRGQTWIHLQLFPKGGAAEAFAIDPRNPNRLALSTVHWGGNAPGGVYLSQNKGNKWLDLTGDLPIGSGASSITFAPDGKFLFANLYAGSIWKLNISSLEIEHKN